MGKKKSDSDLQLLEDDSQGWLLSYADMMTLIACFFILMMSFATYDPIGFNTKATELSRHFTKNFEKPSDLNLKEINQEVARHELYDRTKVSLKDSELVITFSSSLLYPNDVSDMSPQTRHTMDSLIEILKISNQNYRILVEGHSDDSLNENSLHKSQWEVSVARASKVAERFEFYGFPKENIVPIGRSNSLKVYESVNKYGDRSENLAKMNRRVVIRVLEPYKKKKIKLGLGVYFRDAVEDVEENAIPEKDLKEFEIE